jgi:hypothetical protein
MAAIPLTQLIVEIAILFQKYFYTKILISFKLFTSIKIKFLPDPA